MEEQKKQLKDIQKKQVISFLEDLKQMNDNRGKNGRRHHLAFVICVVILAIICQRSSMSSIHRFITNRFKALRLLTGMFVPRVISRAQLPRIIETLDLNELNKLVVKHFGVEIKHKLQKEWYAIDGKTLCGTTSSEDKHGEKVVIAVKHDSKKLAALDHYNGKKDSEIITVRKILKDTGIESNKVTLDALHFNPKTINQIKGAGGTYIIQVKENQSELKDQLESIACNTPSLSEQKSIEKGHGRIEQRSAEFYDISGDWFDKRWENSNFSTLIVVNRKTEIIAKNKTESSTRLYVTNQSIKSKTKTSSRELFNAIRKHWTIESENWVRDVIFNEDNVKTKSKKLGAIMSSLRTAAIQIVRKHSKNKLRETIEKFIDTPKYFEKFIKNIKFV